MSTRTIIVVVLALVCGLCAAVGIQGMKKSPAAVAVAVADPVETVPVLFAADDIKRGDKIMPAAVVVRQFPKGLVPAGALNNAGAAVGQTGGIAMPKGRLITMQDFLPQGPGNPLAGRLRPGMRAITILAPTAPAHLAGALTSGDRIDLLFTRNVQVGSGGPVGGPMTSRLLQNVEVFAVNSRDANGLGGTMGASEVLSFTLLVNPEDALTVDQAQLAGTIHVAYREPGDPTVPQTKRLANQIIAGKRAFTILTPSLSSTAAGFLMPGDFVDVLHSTKDQKSPTPGEALDKMLAAGKAPVEPRNRGGGKSKTILKGVEILAVHTRRDAPQNSQFDPSEILSVTLLVSPEEAEKLDHGQNSGMLSLSIRNPAEPVAALAAPAALAFGCLLANMPSGKRLFKIRIADALLLAQDCNAKDMRVDIILSSKNEVSKAHGLGGAVTMTLLEDVPILDAIEISGDSPDGKPSYEISFAFTPEEVVLVRLGQDVGTLQLSLRGQNNPGVANPPGANPNLRPNPQAVMHLTRTRTITLRGTRVGRDVETFTGPILVPQE